MPPVTEPTFVPVMPLEALAEGRMQRCEIGGREIVLCRNREGVHALDNICSHAFARMNEGRLRGTRLICPLHGASFDVRDGRVLGAPATVPLPCHAVRVVDGQIEVAIDPAAPRPLQPF
jgi:3-phenylpropionate/trans-cinnamate dioxygenase ferredoxin subunit